MPGEPSERAVRGVVLGLVSLALVLPLAFAAITSQAWEDFYIAYRHSVHLAEGHGLTYQVGKRIQGFSSPLATLLLAAAHRLAGGSETGALWAFRIASAGAYAVGLYAILRASLRSGAARSWAALVLPALVYLLDLKSVSFSANGMETGFVLLFLAGSLACLAGPGRGFALGALWAGLLWARADGFVYVGAMALAALAFGRPRRQALPGLLRAAGVCGVLYLPWFAFAWSYYGSPIPQSVAAKAVNTGLHNVADLAQVVERIPEVLGFLYLRPYAQYQASSLVAHAGALAGGVASVYWLLPRGRAFGRVASLVTCFGVVYLAFMPQTYPWYYPAVVVASLPALSALLSDLGALRRFSPALRRGAFATACLVTVVALGGPWREFVTVARVMQRVSEDGNRRPLGLWLAANAGSVDRVYLECPGYIGFYSGLEMLDYPGLVSPAVVSARERLGDGFVVVGASLAPEWMVLRSAEIESFERRSAGWLARHYTLERSFDVSQELKRAAPDQPGILHDATFHVLRRRQGPARSP
jgi:hypothetical protein